MTAFFLPLDLARAPAQSLEARSFLLKPTPHMLPQICTSQRLQPKPSTIALDHTQNSAMSARSPLNCLDPPPPPPQPPPPPPGLGSDMDLLVGRWQCLQGRTQLRFLLVAWVGGALWGSKGALGMGR